MTEGIKKGSENNTANTTQRKQHDANSTVQTISIDASKYAYETVDGKTVISNSSGFSKILDIVLSNKDTNNEPPKSPKLPKVKTPKGEEKRRKDQRTSETP